MKDFPDKNTMLQYGDFPDKNTMLQYGDILLR